MANYGDPNARAHWNRKNAFDAALDALRTNGLNQKQYSNLQGGKLPGQEHGLFMGMTPAQLKQVASFVDAQGTHGDSGKIDPITGLPIPGAMHFNYNDPRTAEVGETSPSVAPWMQGGGGGGGVVAPGPGGLGGGLPGPRPRPGNGAPGPGGGPWTGMGAEGHGLGHHGMDPSAWRAQHQGNGGQFPVRQPVRFPWQNPGRDGLQGGYGGGLIGRPILGGGSGSFRQQLIANAMARAPR